MQELQQTYRQAGNAFNTQGVEDAYNAQRGLNMGEARQATSTMGRAAMNRANRTGGQVASSFAAGSAMLPYFKQDQQMLGDLEDYKMRAATNRLQLQGGLAGQMAGLRQGQQGMLANFYNAQQGRDQQGEQFGQNLDQQQKQFAAQQALQLRNQSFSEEKYDDMLDLQRSEMQAKSPQGPTWGAASAMMGAHNSQSPEAFAYWQRMQQAASQGGYSDSPIFSTGGYPNGGGARRSSYY